MGGGYPLAAALELAEVEVDAERQALAEALDRLEAAEAAVERTRRRVEAQEATIDEGRARMAEAREETSGAALSRGAAHRRRLSVEREALAEELAEAEAARAVAAEVVEEAQGRLLDAEGRRKALARHREAWAAEEGRLAERREEDEVDDRNSALFRRK